MNGGSREDGAEGVGRPPRQERKAQRRARGRRDILDAAERTLGSRGDLGSLTMEDIAAEAGFSAGALYGYFRSKQAIVVELLRRIEDEMLVLVSDSAPPDDSFVDQLRRLLVGFDDMARRHVGLFHAFLVLGWGHAADELDGILRLHEAFLDGVDRIFSRGIQEGSIRDMAPRDLSLTFIGALREFFVHWLFSDRSEPLEERTRRAATIFLRGAATRDTEFDMDVLLDVGPDSGTDGGNR